MKRSYRLGLPLIASLLAGGCQQQIEPLALGMLARDRVVLTATSSELIVQQPIREGSLVRKGDLLVQLDDRLQQAIVAQAEAEVQEAAAHLEELTNGPRDEEIAEAKARVESDVALLKRAKLTLDRARTLEAKKVMGEAELDEAIARRASQHAALLISREQLRLLVNGTRPEALRQAEARLHAAEAHLQQQRTRLTEYHVTATRDGWLDSLPWNVGERVFAGSPVAVTLASSAPFARVYIPEPFRAPIRVGDTLAVSVDGVDEIWQGTVRWIATDPAFTPYYALNAEERSRLMYLAEVQLPETAADLPSGLPAQVELP
ncbi:MAG: HlyD family efflux transporter periplasmic adaptor subunit [Gammaproteobacteria bacterium]|nr:HlyD family efflux transporter periplasmic adaptor subunit [Gammaproteobacteria bacterium]